MSGEDIESILGKAQNPHGGRIQRHNTQICGFSSKRRDKIVNHFSRLHEVRDSLQGRVLAMYWLRTSGNQFWSCSFCGLLFTTFPDRPKRIGTEHVERHQTLLAWDATKVIKGQLFQLGVDRAWTNILASNYGYDGLDLIWGKSDIQDLQHKLELGTSDGSSAGSLAEAANLASKRLHTLPVNQSHRPELPVLGAVSANNHYLSKHDMHERNAAAEHRPWQTFAPSVLTLSDESTQTLFHSIPGSQSGTFDRDQGYSYSSSGSSKDNKKAVPDSAIDPLFFAQADGLEYSDMVEWD